MAGKKAVVKTDKTAGTFLSRFSNSSSTGKNLGNRKLLLPLLGVLLLLGLAYLASTFLVVAWVDNKPISRFAYYGELDKKYGKDQREQMIVETLIESEAQKKDITVTDAEITQEIDKLAQEQGGRDKLDQILKLQNISQDELKKLVKLQIFRQKLFASGQAITDAEVNQYYEQNKANLTGPDTTPDASTEAQLKQTVRQQLGQQRLNATFSAWVQENLQSNRVVRVPNTSPPPIQP